MQNIGHKTYNLLFIINTAELFSQTMSVNCTYMYLHEYNTGYKSMRIMSWKNQAKYYCNSLIFKTVNRQYIVSDFNCIGDLNCIDLGASSQSVDLKV